MENEKIETPLIINNSFFELASHEDYYFLPLFDDIKEVEMKIITGKLLQEQHYRAIIKIKLARGNNDKITNETHVLKALIDTGATVTNIKPSIFKQLNPIPTNQPYIQTDSNTGHKIETVLHLAFYNLPDLDNNQWSALPLISNSNVPPYVDLVVGTNFLTPFKFIYNGNEKFFELEYLHKV
jgi:hypothetical protein